MEIPPEIRAAARRALALGDAALAAACREEFLVAGGPDADWFLQLGESTLRIIRDVLQRQGVPLERLGAVLEFGCGCGRIIRHWQAVKGIDDADRGDSLIWESGRQRLLNWGISQNDIDQLGTEQEPRKTMAIWVASRPRVWPVASTTYHSRPASISLAVALYVLTSH